MIFSVQPVKLAVEPVTRDPVNFSGHCPVRVLKRWFLVWLIYTPSVHLTLRPFNFIVLFII